ncbi:hypothetical protein [Psychromicrobium lacuslunae]|uniref:Uncharacterized protein n=1 Tax=Psychromicrobium lacuslunae TaxID=1618207 RepID=A0A0D4C011_9MICC|nr:hypothetical protein [Psychromicrobium lacuslunae]AJT41740.1 hypothetical protein UM93_09845 [Psychromicrobium lacuslunae]
MIKIIGSALLGAGIAALLVSFLVPVWWLIALGVTGITLGFIWLLLRGMARSVLGGFRGDPKEFREVTANGQLAWAEILGLSRTGMVINDSDHGVELSLGVLPHAGYPFKTKTRTLIPITEMPGYQPGTRIAVRMSGKYPGVVVVEKNPPAEFLRSVPRAGATSFVGVPEFPGAVPKGRSKLSAVLQIAAFLLAAAMVVVPFKDPVISFFQGNSEKFAGVNALSEEYGNHVIEELKKVTGGTKFTSINFYPGRVRAEAPTTPGSNKVDDFSYDAGGASREGPSSIQPQKFDDEVFDVGKLSFANLQSFIDRAPELTKVANGKVTMVRLDRWSAKPAVFTISVSGDYGDGSVAVSTSGVGLWVETEDEKTVILHSLLEPANLPVAFKELQLALKGQKITQLTLTPQSLEAQVDAGAGSASTGIWTYSAGSVSFAKQNLAGGIGSVAERSFPLPQLSPKQIQTTFKQLKGTDSQRLTISREVSLSINSGEEWKGGELVFTYTSQDSEGQMVSISTNAQGVRRP